VYKKYEDYGETIAENHVLVRVNDRIHGYYMFHLPYYFDFQDFKDWAFQKYPDYEGDRPAIHVEWKSDWITIGAFYDQRAQDVIDGIAPLIKVKPADVDYKKFQHRPIAVLATRLQKNVNLPDINWSAFHEDWAFVLTENGQSGGQTGDWVIKGERGWAVVISDRQFKQLYEGL